MRSVLKPSPCAKRPAAPAFPINAPYRHFRDKDELLAAVAVQGFERLNAAMKRSAASGKTPRERFRLCGRGYLSFALRWPQHFLVMFDLPSARDKYPEYAAAGEEAFATLMKFVVECQEAGALAGGDPVPLAFMAWSMVHGIAKLELSSHLPFSRAVCSISRTLPHGSCSGNDG